MKEIFFMHLRSLSFLFLVAPDGHSLSAFLSNMLLPRHGDHSHYINVKYGYIIVILSTVYALLTEFLARDGSSLGRHRITKRLYLHSLAIKLTLWITVITVVLVISPPKLSVILKRFARISYSLTPLIIYLSLRPQNITAYSIGFYLHALPLHKWISRILLFLATLHSIGFMIKWTVAGVFWEKITKLDNFYGLLIFIVIPPLLVLSTFFFRRKNYNLFYLIHNITSWVFIFIIYLHARPSVGVITLISSALLLYQLYIKFIESYLVSDITITEIENSTLKIITIKKPQNFPLSVLPGSHIRINFRGRDPRSWLLPSHPFTIASISNETLSLIVRSSFFKPNFEYSLSGAFPSLPQSFFINARIVNILCGGSGISFGLPLYKYFKKRSERNVIVKLIWCVRKIDDVNILKEFDLYPEQIGAHSQNSSGLIEENFKLRQNAETPTPIASKSGKQGSSVHNDQSPHGGSRQHSITSDSDEKYTSHDLRDSNNESKSDASRKSDKGNSSELEIKQSQNSIDNLDISIYLSSASSNILLNDVMELNEMSLNSYKIINGKPNLDEIFDNFKGSTGEEDESNNGKWLISCGPKSLVTDSYNWSTKNNRLTKNKIEFHAETYDM